MAPMAEPDTETAASPAGVPDGLRSRVRRAMRAEVAAAALELFITQGFDNTTIDQIAAAAGMSRSSFFRYFPTKEDTVLGDLAGYGHGSMRKPGPGRPCSSPKSPAGSASRNPRPTTLARPR